MRERPLSSSVFHAFRFVVTIVCLIRGFAVIGCLVMVRRVHIWSKAGIHYDTNMDLISGSKFGEDIYPNI